MDDPSIDPPDGIGNICTIDGDLITDEEIFCYIFLDPFAITALFLNRPSLLAHFPYLKGGFFDCLTVGRDTEQREEK
jgi:hypothetical protein